MIAAPHSNSGKTLVSLGLARALRDAGHRVRPAKSGPDYIDPQFLARAAGTDCINLDAWAMGAPRLRALGAFHAGADGFLLVEGVMGLFDGASSGSGNTADLAERLGLPVVLVIDVAHMAQSVAALAEGFMHFRPGLAFAGVILNRVASDRHEAMLRDALAVRDIPCLGALRANDALSVPDRHLGLVQPEEIAGIDPLIDKAAEAVRQGIDIAALLALSGDIELAENARRLPPLGQHIAIARDKAFGFLYPHWLADWRNAGAELSFFSPLADEAPDIFADAVFLPGGYPELHGARLASASRFKAGLVAARDRDALIYGECGRLHGARHASDRRQGPNPRDDRPFAARDGDRCAAPHARLSPVAPSGAAALRPRAFWTRVPLFDLDRSTWTAALRRQRCVGQAHRPDGAGRRQGLRVVCPCHRHARGLVMAATALMFMGTGSDAGKSLIVAGLCRACHRRGIKVAPFKPQNMSNNAAVTVDGGEIGRAQALQARAAGRDPVTAMNPILLKPEAESGAQVVLRGKRVGSMAARDYFRERQRFLPDVLDAFHALCDSADLVLIEGAGSASEINLRQSDLANFGFARAVNAPVVLIGDIERGGVIAALVGTFAVIDPADAGLIVATLINRFRGDPSLFEDGLKLIAEKTGRPALGPLPYFAEAGKLPAEDALALEREASGGTGNFHIVVPRLPRIANFDDLDPLRAEPGVRVTVVSPGMPLPRDADLILLPGSKATRGDLAALRAEGWDIDIAALVRTGGAVLGLCAGYQMLGKTIADPDGVEGAPGVSEGLGLLDVETVLTPVKELRLEKAVHAHTGAAISGYHMHMGETSGPARTSPFSLIDGAGEGAVSPSGRVMGTYLHGLFAENRFRHDFLAALGALPEAGLDYEAGVDAVLDALADHLEQALDLDALLALAREPEAHP